MADIFPAWVDWFVSIARAHFDERNLLHSLRGFKYFEMVTELDRPVLE
jgi:hypothetical protein